MSACYSLILQIYRNKISASLQPKEFLLLIKDLCIGFHRSSIVAGHQSESLNKKNKWQIRNIDWKPVSFLQDFLKIYHNYKL